MKNNRYLLGFALLVAGALPAFSQVSNNNEDGVYKVDQRFARDFVPGQVLVKFKDDSNISVQRSAEGHFRAASINNVDKLLKQYGVEEMENLYPAEKAKPTSQLRSKRAPNGTIVKERNLDKVFLLKMGEDKPVRELVKQLKEMPEVEYAEPNYKAYITADIPSGLVTGSPYQKQITRRAPVSIETTARVICPKPSQNPLYFHQYGITQQNIHKLWNKPIINKKRPVIAILDTGIDVNHPDLKDNIWMNTAEVDGETAYDDDGNGIVDDKYGWNFVDDYIDLTDRNGHGTHVAGIAAAADNNIGIVGANPLALIMPIKVMNDRGIGDDATIARGIIYAAENGADVINMSFGSSSLSKTMKDALDRAYQTSILVASAGNNGKDIYYFVPPISGTFYPAAYYLVLGVEASGSDLQRAGYSNYDPDGPIYSEDGIDGRNYEVQVPGDKIYSTLPDGKYNQLSGTSMSAPLLAGAISALQMVKDYPSKDVLFGDLIHLKADFGKIYSDNTPRMPKIDLISLDPDDNVKGNNNIDGQVDVGETIKFSPVLRNTWADATDIKLKLMVDDAYKSFVTIQNPEVNFGHNISAYGRETAKTPITVKFGNNIGDNTRIKFILEVSYHESTESFIYDVYVTVNNMVKIGGIISEDRTLTADHTYLINKNIGVMEGATLTIEPGTVIKVNCGISVMGHIAAKGTPNNPIRFIGDSDFHYWNAGNGFLVYPNDVNKDIIEYCKFDHCSFARERMPIFKNCELRNSCLYIEYALEDGDFIKCNFIDGGLYIDNNYPNLSNGCNIINEHIFAFPWTGVKDCNIINSYDEYYDWSFAFNTNTPSSCHNDNPPYIGTAKSSIARNLIADMNRGVGYGQIDLSNMRTTPIAEAHGIVWKVCVNGKDAQDEYEDLAPLGVGKHKFEVYFNRPMNKAVTPQISFGVREPYTQNVVAEDGSWNEEGTIYTAYKTITGRTMSDGINRIYVYGAEDNEYFECPYEKTRFNINIQAAGSMATGFVGEAGLGRVNLTWNNENNDFEDAMGFNIYRYTIDDEGKADTICSNKDIVDIETTEYTDYDVTPGTTYYYLYKVLSTDLKEYDVSNVVAVTPQTSTEGDANGSGDVDVADVITTVNYAAGMDPKPFIFEAADMNKDNMIDILDVVGIIQKILNPAASREMTVESVATYTIEDGVVYVDSPVDLAGVQVQLTLDGRSKKEEVRVSEDLSGFEQTSAWLTDNDYLFLAYNMNGKTLSAGKHALLTIGDAEIASICLSNSMGGNVSVVEDGTTSIQQTTDGQHTAHSGIYNIHGQRVAASANQLPLLKKGVYIVDGKKVIKWK